MTKGMYDYNKFNQFDKYSVSSRVSAGSIYCRAIGQKNRTKRVRWVLTHHCGPVAYLLTGVKVYKQMIHLRFKTANFTGSSSRVPPLAALNHCFPCTAAILNGVGPRMCFR